GPRSATAPSTAQSVSERSASTATRAPYRPSGTGVGVGYGWSYRIAGPRRSAHQGRRGHGRRHGKVFIRGRGGKPATGAATGVISPHSEEVVAKVPEASTADVDRAVAAARDAFDNGEWPRLSPQERIEAVERFAGIYASRLGDMAEVITTEMGSP